MAKKDNEPILKTLPNVFAPAPGAVLVYQNRKSGPTLIDVSTRQKMENGLKWLFTHLKDEWQAYLDLEVSECDEPIEIEMAELRTAISVSSSKNIAKALQKRLCELQSMFEKSLIRGRSRQVSQYAKAKEGDVKAIAMLLYMRRTYEYECWSIVSMIDPTPAPEAVQVPEVPPLAEQAVQAAV